MEDFTEQKNVDYDKLDALYLNPKEPKFRDDLELFEGRLGITTYLSEKVYDSKTYEIEEKLKVKNDKGAIEEKRIPLENYIRFIINDKHKLKSNAKLVEWSDGSMQLFVGKKYFDIMTAELNNSRMGVVVDEKMSLIGESINKRMVACLSEEDSNKIHKLNDNQESKMKISYTVNDKRDKNNNPAAFSKKFNKKFMNRKRNYK